MPAAAAAAFAAWAFKNARRETSMVIIPALDRCGLCLEMMEDKGGREHPG